MPDRARIPVINRYTEVTSSLLTAYVTIHVLAIKADRYCFMCCQGLKYKVTCFCEKFNFILKIPQIYMINLKGCNYEKHPI